MTWLILIPLSCAFSCWLVIKILVAVLFRPYHSKSFLGLKIQGILPAKQLSIANKTGKLVAEQFFSIDLIEQKITDPANLQKIMPAIEEHIDDFLRHKLKKQMPFIGVFIGDKTIGSLKKVFITELETLFPKIMTDYAANLASDLNIQTLVSEKINAMGIQEIEAAFQQNFRKEFRVVQFVAISLGLVIGFITSLIIILIK